MLSSTPYSDLTYSKYSQKTVILKKKSNNRVSSALPFPSRKISSAKWDNFLSLFHLSLLLWPSTTSFHSEAENNLTLCYWDLQLLSIGNTARSHNSWKYTIFAMKRACNGSVFLHKSTNKVEGFECGAKNKLKICAHHDFRVAEECRNVEILWLLAREMNIFGELKRDMVQQHLLNGQYY